MTEMSLETYYRILKHDPTGRLVRDTGPLPSHSYVIQFLEMLRPLWNKSPGNVNATDVTGANSVIIDGADEIGYYGKINAGLADDTYGIVVGTNAGTTAEDNLNYALDTKILHSGVGAADKLNYQAVTFVAPRVVGSNIDLDISRPFLNESGGTITVKEIGIICKNSRDTKYHLLLRDVVTDEAVEDGYTLTVVYTLRTTV
ncbi:MAG: hypothetical protein CEE41_04480 [Hadesarchaea archaeon B3_Hades]|nr:MAG: hypothetical protein CEE41_04480 [Hadesarchaea archaeon B3_Hades]